ncbi:hypothetical protein SCHPADRAFT_891816 [Schizopora paradoxa]|uniref:Uncharacterized protein n=1 Tax=Schizopora paradoxa TaxID=27342 RepID=A0A0H2RHT8_9AGAM|nr:hypothetical protein SCHPADRAFT_891816 [Schizopora paradoxa]
MKGKKNRSGSKENKPPKAPASSSSTPPKVDLEKLLQEGSTPKKLLSEFEEFHVLQQASERIVSLKEYEEHMQSEPFVFKRTQSPDTWTSQFANKINELVEPFVIPPTEDKEALDDLMADRIRKAEWLKAGINTILGFAYSRVYANEVINQSTSKLLKDKLHMFFANNGFIKSPGDLMDMLLGVALVHDKDIDTLFNQVVSLREELSVTQTALNLSEAQLGTTREKLSISESSLSTTQENLRAARTSSLTNEDDVEKFKNLRQSESKEHKERMRKMQAQYDALQGIEHKLLEEAAFSKSENERLETELKVVKDEFAEHIRECTSSREKADEWVESLTAKFAALQTGMEEKLDQKIAAIQLGVDDNRASIDEVRADMAPRISLLEGTITGKFNPGFVILRSFLDSVCEDVTWLAGYTNSPNPRLTFQPHSAWEKAYIVAGSKARAEVNIRVKAISKALALKMVEIRNPGTQNLAMGIFDSYFKVLECDASENNGHIDHENCTVTLAFNPNSKTCRLGSTHAHKPGQVKDTEAAIKDICPPEEKERVLALFKAHIAFRRRLYALSMTYKEMTQEEKRQVANILPEFVRALEAGRDFSVE